MAAAYLLIFGSTLLMGCTALIGLWWASKTGQFRDMRGGAESIFDKDEPVGQPTDMIFKTPMERRKEQKLRR